MNAAELIASGLLEAYVLGQVSPEEARLVQASRASDPLVAAELDAIEGTLQEFAMRNAVPPPATSKASIFEHIEALNRKVQNSTPISRLQGCGLNEQMSRHLQCSYGHSHTYDFTVV